MSTSNFIKKNNFIFLILSAIIMLVLSFVIIMTGRHFGRINAAKNDITKYSASGFFFDTFITIDLYSDTDVTDELTYALNLCKKYESLFSKTYEESDIYKLNKNRHAALDPETARLLILALYISKLTDGNFDITAGTVLQGYSIEEKKIYDDETVSLLLSAISYEFVELYCNGITVSDLSLSELYSLYLTFDISTAGKFEAKLLNDDTLIDMGGIAKGYIADRLKEYFVKNGIEHGIINLGGNVLTIGGKISNNNASETNYIIGIQKPFAANGEYITTVEISDLSAVTSGIYQRYFMSGNEIYHHIFSPFTGKPVNNDIASVTIIASSSALCDGLSTAIMVAGEEIGREIINKINELGIDMVSCIIIDKNNNITGF